MTRSGTRAATLPARRGWRGAGRVVRVGDPGHVGLVVDRVRHRLEVVAEVLRRHGDRARAARLRGQRVDREGVLRIHRRAPGPEEGERHQLEHVVRAVAEHDLRHVDAVAPRRAPASARSRCRPGSARSRASARSIAARVRGPMPRGFSLEASLTMPASSSPISRASSEIGLPGW